MDNTEVKAAANEAVIEDDLLVDIELLSDDELARVGGGQGIVFL